MGGLRDDGEVEANLFKTAELGSVVEILILFRDLLYFFEMNIWSR